ncbi:magnesium chelatase [Ignavibacteriales bacterium]
MSFHIEEIKTVRDLKIVGYKTRTIKDELRDNLISSLKRGEEYFSGIHGYEETVIPDLKRAILSRHNILFLGLRGQAKTRIARTLVNLLDEYIPIIKGSELMDDPFEPVSAYGKSQIVTHGDDTEIEWIHRDKRYTEKLATPDVSVADLIGDVDPIKAAALKLPYSDERVIHYGLIPRSHRSIFVINELPDLQARIQVALFNILQEEDIQIRGFKMKLPLDVQFIFTANPEDYTNRGSIVTPLKDRIDSQILTHYPKSIEVSKNITKQEAKLHTEQSAQITCSPLIEDLVEQVAFEARKSEFVDEKSGVSARLTISSYENLFSSAELRCLETSETNTFIRISDLFSTIPSITGKIELVYEGEQEGPSTVAHLLISKAIRTIFQQYFPSPEKKGKKDEGKKVYAKILDWFAKGNKLDLMSYSTQKEYENSLLSVTGLMEIVQEHVAGINKQEKFLFAEFLLHGMCEYSLISRFNLTGRFEFKDMLSSMFSLEDSGDDEFDQDKY